jgi:hypothetical protein
MHWQSHVGTAALGCPPPEQANGLSPDSIVRSKFKFVPLILVVLTACSPRDFLTRRLAADLVSGSPELKVQQEFMLRTGIVTSKDYPSPEYMVLQHHGWISSNVIGCSPGLTPAPCWNILLTPSGVETVRTLVPADQSGRSSISIPVARRELLGVTGITKQDNSADVEFEWKWVPLNEIGSALYTRDLRYRSTVGFRKFDDGWRLIESAAHPFQTMDDALKNAESIP